MSYVSEEHVILEEPDFAAEHEDEIHVETVIDSLVTKTNGLAPSDDQSLFSIYVFRNSDMKRQPILHRSFDHKSFQSCREFELKHENGHQLSLTAAPTHGSTAVDDSLEVSGSQQQSCLFLTLGEDGSATQASVENFDSPVEEEEEEVTVTRIGVLHSSAPGFADHDGKLQTLTLKPTPIGDGGGEALQSFTAQSETSQKKQHHRLLREYLLHYRDTLRMLLEEMAASADAFALGNNYYKPNDTLLGNLLQNRKICEMTVREADKLLLRLASAGNDRFETLRGLHLVDNLMQAVMLLFKDLKKLTSIRIKQQILMSALKEAFAA